jgi:hypothetical protein
MTITTEQKQLDAKEFTSMLTSCLLSAEFNSKQPNKAIKHTLRCVESRVISPRIKAVCQQGRKQIFPLGWLQKQLNNVSRIGGLSPDEFLKIGASL